MHVREFLIVLTKYEGGSIMADQSVTRSVRPFGRRDKVGYLLGGTGGDLGFMLITNYMFIFFTQYIGISLVHYSFIILLTKIWDGINDPIIGIMADRFNPKSGDKFRPWIFWGSFPLAFSFCLMFINTNNAPYWVRILILLAGYLIWDICYTVVSVPYSALNATITADPLERSQLSTFRSVGSFLAVILTTVLLPKLLYREAVLKNGETISKFQGQNLFIIAIVFGVLTLVCFQLLYRSCSERIKHDKPAEEKFNYLRTLKSFFSNRSMLGLSLTTMTSLIFMLSFMSTNLLVFQMYYRDGKLSSLSMIIMLPTLFVIPVIKPLVRRFGKRFLCSWPFLIGAVSYLILFLMPQVPLAVFIGLQALASLTMGIYSRIDWALVADGVDSIELQTGRREEGSIVATYIMLRKIAQGISQAFIPFLIAVVIPGLNMNDSMTWSVGYGLQIKNITAGLCFIGFTLAFVFMRFVYDIDKKRELELPILLGRATAVKEAGLNDAIEEWPCGEEKSSDPAALYEGGINYGKNCGQPE